MIAWLEGVLREKAPTRIVLDVRGVGYELLVPLSTFDALPDPGKTVSLLVHTAVREDAIQLFGFASSLEKELFHLLRKASRVGPKLAQSILSGMEPLRLLQLLRDADAKGLRKAPGVGPKLAERIVVELRDEAEKLAGRLGTAGAASGPGTLPGVEPGEELLSALVNLGYPRSQAERVVESALAEADRDSSLEELIRVALRRLAR
ncbi:MAG TPA: Holliday junction branch migration protein RuvA [Deltaproteobacteria bacterium]|nr:Holliday junction branch migration protein RuvA [Deltaproteobacteria bacterium]